MKETVSNQKKTTDFRRIILPVDGSKSSSRAVKKALSLAKETGADVTALHVIEFPYLASVDLNTTYPDVMDIMKKQGNTFLDTVKKQGSKLGVHVKIKLIEGIPDDEIIKEAKKDDLIIMGCKGRTALGRILVGSVCEKVVHHSKSPVMIIR
jgi:nucleotide-binding universal stress UspA family protein